ncbi:MAG: hypothetical protein WCA85_16660 [Paraburkholderia sp.]|uniref:glycan biosynthesis hexose transferase WsfD n=1 Tax=Paraburkholderia sp. TaxID=1926495 RepID=UPI003C48832E
MAVTAAVLLFTVGKMFAITMASPLFAYSNHFDFIRVESCMGLWQDYGDGSDKTAPHVAGPVNRLVLDRDVRMDLCVVSLDNLFPYIATRLHRHDGHVDFRQISGLRIAAALAALWALIAAARGRGRSLVVAGLFTAIFGEIGYLAYFNTLYNEFTMLLGAFVCAASLWLLGTSVARPPRRLLVLMVVGLLMLGLAKQQYSGLATAFGLCAALVVAKRWNARRAAATFALVGLLCPPVFAVLNPSDYGLQGGIKMANITDTFLGAVLPAAKDPASALATLHLPASCVNGIGKDWYTPGLQENHPCPELRRATRARLIPLFVSQPGTFFGPVSRAIDLARPFPDPGYGMFEDPRSSNDARYRLAVATSFATYADALPQPVFRWLMSVAMVSGVVASVWYCVKLLTGRTDRLGIDLLLAMGGITVLYAIGSSVFGDGVFDMTRHASLWCFGLATQALAILVWIAAAVLRGGRVKTGTTPQS